MKKRIENLANWVSGLFFILVSLGALAAIAIIVVVFRFDVSSSLIGYEEVAYWGIIALLCVGAMMLGIDLIRHRHDGDQYIVAIDVRT